MLMITPVLVKTDMMIADVFTKAVDEEIFHRCKHALRNTNRESYYLRSISIGESLYSAPKSGLDRLLGCD